MSPRDAELLSLQCQQGRNSAVQSEDDVLRWLAQEYDLSFSALEGIELDRQLLSLFPARILFKEQVLPLSRTNGTVEIATSRLFSTQGLDALKTLTGLKLKPVLAPTEAIQREIKKQLGVGADTLGTLEEETPLQVVDEDRDEDTSARAEQHRAELGRGELSPVEADAVSQPIGAMREVNRLARAIDGEGVLPAGANEEVLLDPESLQGVLVTGQSAVQRGDHLFHLSLRASGGKREERSHRERRHLSTTSCSSSSRYALFTSFRVMTAKAL